MTLTHAINSFYYNTAFFNYQYEINKKELENLTKFNYRILFALTVPFLYDKIKTGGNLNETSYSLGNFQIQ